MEGRGRLETAQDAWFKQKCQYRYRMVQILKSWFSGASFSRIYMKFAGVAKKNVSKM